VRVEDETQRAFDRVSGVHEAGFEGEADDGAGGGDAASDEVRDGSAFELAFDEGGFEQVGDLLTLVRAPGGVVDVKMRLDAAGEAVEIEQAGHELDLIERGFEEEEAKIAKATVGEIATTIEVPLTRRIGGAEGGIVVRTLAGETS
jgi:hypothetical protein